MATETLPPKPITEVWRPEHTRLPSLHLARRLFRRAARALARVVLWAITCTSVSGLEHLPADGPALIAFNHLGDADAALLLAGLPAGGEVLVKIEMLDYPVVGRLLDWYGVIWLHRGRPDRRALRSALQALGDGRMVLVAPEGRYSLADGLEPGGNGAAYLARKAGVPVVPAALTGSQNGHVYGSLRRFRRPRLSLTFGKPITLEPRNASRASLGADTERIMRALAALLPPKYRGVYK